MDGGMESPTEGGGRRLTNKSDKQTKLRNKSFLYGEGEKDRKR